LTTNGVPTVRLRITVQLDGADGSSRDRTDPQVPTTAYTRPFGGGAKPLQVSRTDCRRPCGTEAGRDRPGAASPA
jgi:hypothetical protein